MNSIYLEFHTLFVDRFQKTLLCQIISLVHRVIELQTLCPIRRSDCKGAVAVIRRSFYPRKQAFVEFSRTLEKRRIYFKEIVLHKTRSLSFFPPCLCNFPLLPLLFFFSFPIVLAEHRIPARRHDHLPKQWFHRALHSIKHILHLDTGS